MSLADPQTDGDPVALVPGVSPQIYGPADFARIAELMRRETGVVLSERKRMLAYSRLAPLVRASGAATFAAYIDLLAENPGELGRTISALTTNHTYFHREPHHFEHFAQAVRPDLVRRALAGEAVRLWSAGCSSGEEVWTLMMVLLGEEREAGRRLVQCDLRMLASDIADDVLARAKQATYPAEALAALPEALRRTWCEPAADMEDSQFRMVPELRAPVRFRRLNLFGDWPFRGSFDVIFCRNVMIYFDAPAKEQLVLGFARRLHPGGYLYIGHSERVIGAASALLDQVGPTIYRRNER